MEVSCNYWNPLYRRGLKGLFGMYEKKGSNRMCGSTLKNPCGLYRGGGCGISGVLDVEDVLEVSQFPLVDRGYVIGLVDVNRGRNCCNAPYVFAVAHCCDS
jgi:hypothetical protein